MRAVVLWGGAAGGAHERVQFPSIPTVHGARSGMPPSIASYALFAHARFHSHRSTPHSNGVAARGEVQSNRLTVPSSVTHALALVTSQPMRVSDGTSADICPLTPPWLLADRNPLDSCQVGSQDDRPR